MQEKSSHAFHYGVLNKHNCNNRTHIEKLALAERGRNDCPLIFCSLGLIGEPTITAPGRAHKKKVSLVHMDQGNQQTCHTVLLGAGGGKFTLKRPWKSLH